MLAEPLLGMNGGAPDTEASSMSADAAENMPAEAMPGLEGGAADVEASSMSVEPEIELATLGDAEAASAGGHPPQMAVLASLDQVSVLLFLRQLAVNGMRAIAYSNYLCLSELCTDFFRDLAVCPAGV